MDFLTWFGREWADNNIYVGVLSHLAAKMADPNEDLTLESIDNLDASRLNENEKVVYQSQLELHGDNLQNLLKRFRIGHYLQTLAAKLPNDLPRDVNELEKTLLNKVKAVAKVTLEGRRSSALALTRALKRVYKKLQRIKEVQIAGGKRLSLLSKLASLLMKDGEDAVKSELAGFAQHVKKGRTNAEMMQMVRDTAKAQKEGDKRLVVLNDLASLLIAQGEDAVKLRLGDLAQHVKDGRTNEDMMQMIRGAAKAQKESGEKLGAFSRLAGLYTKGEISQDNIDTLVDLWSSKSEDEVMEMLKDRAKKCRKTFDGRVKQLVACIRSDENKHWIQNVADDNNGGQSVKVVVVHNSNRWRTLYQWWEAQIEFALGNQKKYNHYGIVAHQHTELREILEKIGVVFDRNDLVLKAYRQMQHVHENMGKSEQAINSSNEAKDVLQSMFGGDVTDLLS